MTNTIHNVVSELSVQVRGPTLATEEERQWRKEAMGKNLMRNRYPFSLGSAGVPYSMITMGNEACP